MGCHQPLWLEGSGSDADHVAAFLRDGFAIVRGLFSKQEIESIAAASDQVHAEGVAHGRSFRHGNLFYDVDPGPAGFTGSLLVAEFDSLDAARAWADADPYLGAGAWTHATVRPFLKVLP